MPPINDERPDFKSDIEEGAAEPAPVHRPVFSLLLILAVCACLLFAAIALIYLAFFSKKTLDVAADGPAPQIQQESRPAPPVADAAQPPAIVEEPLAEQEATPTPDAAAPGPSGPPAALKNFMREMQVSGIRISVTEMRAIINGRTYAVGDRLPIRFELRLVGVAPGQLEFRDAAGVTYRKHF